MLYKDKNFLAREFNNFGMMRIMKISRKKNYDDHHRWKKNRSRNKK